MNRPSENSIASQTIRQRLQAPDFQNKFDYAEAEDVGYYQFSLPAPEASEGITCGPQVTSRIYERVFWVAPKKGVMDNPRQMNDLLDEVSKGLFSYSRHARVEKNRLIYGRKDFWESPIRCLNLELVVLPHREVLKMLQNYYGNKENGHPILAFEDKAGLAYSISVEQLRLLREREFEQQRELRASRTPTESLLFWGGRLRAKFRSKER